MKLKIFAISSVIILLCSTFIVATNLKLIGNIDDPPEKNDIFDGSDTENTGEKEGNELFEEAFVELKGWKCDLKEFFYNYLRPATSINELKKDFSYDKLRTFFMGCSTPDQFYERIQQHVTDATNQNQADLTVKLDYFGAKLADVANTITDNDSTIWCHQQLWLMIAGIIATFSHYDDELQMFVLNKGCGDFKFEVWRTWDLDPPILPYRSHVYLVVDSWNGTDSFIIGTESFDKILMDTYWNEYVGFEHERTLLGPKLNSYLYTIDV